MSVTSLSVNEGGCCFLVLFAEVSGLFEAEIDIGAQHRSSSVIPFPIIPQNSPFFEQKEVGSSRACPEMSGFVWFCPVLRENLWAVGLESWSPSG